MKKIFCLLLMCIVTLASFSQKLEPFKIQTDGSIKIESTQKTYLVVEFPGVCAKDIKDKIYNNVLRVYRDPKSVVSASDEVITIHGIEKDVTTYKDLMWGYKYWSIDYTLTFQFKDEKLRIDFPVVKLLNQFGVSHYLSEIVKEHLTESNNRFKKKRIENVTQIENRLNLITTALLIADKTAENEEW